MSKLPKRLIIVGIVATAVLAGLLLFSRPGKEPAGELQVSATESAPAAPAEGAHTAFFTKRAPKAPAQPSESTARAAALPTATNSITAWQATVDEILGSTQPDADKARQMLELFPQLPPAGQEEVARHLSNLLPDEDFGLLRGYLTNAALPEEVSEVILEDVLNRPNSVKLPALLEVARTTQHPKAAEAKDFLELLLDEDYGENWDQWHSRMQQWLAENPD